MGVGRASQSLLDAEDPPPWGWEAWLTP